MCFPWALARLLPSAVRVRIRSRSTSASPPSTASIKRPVLLVLSAHGSAKDRNCALASTMRLTMPNRSKVLRARRSIRVTVRLNRTSDVPDDLRANFEELGEPVVAQLVGRPYTQATSGVPAWAKNEADRRHALSWLSEKRRRANRKQWIGWGVGWFLSLIVMSFAVYNRWLAIQEDRPNSSLQAQGST